MAAIFSRKPAYAAAVPATEPAGDLRARLMAAAADDGAFGDPVIVDGDTGIASRFSGFGFADK